MAPLRRLGFSVDFALAWAFAHPPLSNTLSLHDIDAERLGYADALAKRISVQTGADAKITYSFDRLTAVDRAR